MAANAGLARYKPVFDRMRAMRPHQLSDELEKFLHDESVVGASAWNKLFDETMAGLMFTVEGEAEELNLEATLNLLTDPDRAQGAKRQRGRWRRGVRQECQAFRPHPQHAGEGKGNPRPLAQDADAAARPAPVEPCRARGCGGAEERRCRRLSQSFHTATTG
jgi:hypothetical protein